MKPHYFLLLLPFLLLASCSQTDLSVSKEELELDFNVLNYEQVNLDSLTRAANVGALNHLAMGIYDAATLQPVQPATIQDKEDDRYGRFSVRLPYGKYYLAFLGYMSRNAIHMDAPSRIFWDNNSVTNTFLCCSQLEVDGQTQAEQNIVLKRAVALFSLRVQGNAPQALSQFRVRMQGGSYSLNAVTGLGNAADVRDYTIRNFDNHKESETFDVDFYAFLPQASCKAAITVQALDAEGNVLRERTFADVPLKLNQLTRYTGDFFAEDATPSQFSLTLENDVWDEVDYNF